MGRFHVRVLAEVAGPPPALLLPALPPGCRPCLLHGDSWTVLAWGPDRGLAGRLRPRRGGGSGLPGPRARWPLGGPDPGARLAAALARETWTLEDPALPAPACGWLGWLAFECGHAWEPFPWVAPDPAGLPDYHLARYRAAVAGPAGGDRLFLLWAEPRDAPAASSRRERQALLATWRQLLAAPPPEPGDLPAPPLEPVVAAAAWQARVAALRERIAAGGLYQANLSHRLEGPAPADPRRLHLAVRRRQPTAWGGYWEDRRGRALLSWSPECFLEVRGDRLRTRPIKGTARRVGEPAADAAARAALEASAKERAELTMIVDMARNDLGRLAPPGGVRVRSAGEVEAFPTLYHRTATVEARWSPGDGIGRLLAATFPPASVTGAPKVAALQAIAELEGEGRGPFCGTLLAWFPGPEPAGRLSVCIRTAVVARGRLSLRVGAGIVWDSEPAQEWQETLLKARFLTALADPSPATPFLPAP